MSDVMVVAGATGLIGIELLGRLLRDEAFDGRVVVRPHAARTDAHQKNRNLLLSGTASIDSKPTLEIFHYDALAPRPETAVNRPGFGHIAFEVEDVPSAREAVLAEGGQPVGEIVSLATATGAKVTWVYVTDPEGNVIELQAWGK